MLLLCCCCCCCCCLKDWIDSMWRRTAGATFFRLISLLSLFGSVGSVTSTNSFSFSLLVCLFCLLLLLCWLRWSNFDRAGKNLEHWSSLEILWKYLKYRVPPYKKDASTTSTRRVITNKGAQFFVRHIIVTIMMRLKSFVHNSPLNGCKLTQWYHMLSSQQCIMLWLWRTKKRNEQQQRQFHSYVAIADVEPTLIAVFHCQLCVVSQTATIPWRERERWQRRYCYKSSSGR